MLNTKPVKMRHAMMQVMTLGTYIHLMPATATAMVATKKIYSMVHDRTAIHDRKAQE